MKAHHEPVASTKACDSIGARIVGESETEWFDSLLKDKHYLGAGRSVGDYLRQVVELNGKVVALLVWGPACYALRDRDEWVGWTSIQRIERLKLVVQNRRYLLLTAKGEHPNLASQAMGAALRALPEQWNQSFGYRPLLAETFTDPEAYAGTCYKASNWEPVGMSAGHKRHRADFYVPNDRPKKLWLRPLCPEARVLLAASELPDAYRKGLSAAPSGTLPVNAPQLDSLRTVFLKAPDPRGRNTRFRGFAVLTIIALALLAGRRDIAEIARFATLLSQAQRRRLGLPRKQGTKAFWQVPSYSVFYQVLTRMDPEAFAKTLSTWLENRAGSLPGALALDGKMIRDHIGLLTLAQHEDGTPVAVAVYDQKEGTERCELNAASALLEQIPALDGKLITADPLHCQRKHAATIVEKGGDYLLQIKANQPKLLAKAQALNGLAETPFLHRQAADTDALKNGRSIPGQSNH
jgi:hypothetical protein